ncbi:MAG: hypothetical protein ABJH07_19605 [Sedimentitalea sp.]|uniref:hypothetical protein n=1 Tax=Sedimentitalea sp. TaxID=2048915 RepID=UPI003265708B
MFAVKSIDPRRTNTPLPLLGIDALSRLRGTASQVADPILTGHRHVELVKEAMRMVELADDNKELQANLAGIRDDW